MILNINTEAYWELGDFIFDNLPNKAIESGIFNIRDYFGEELTNVKSLEFLTGFTLNAPVTGGATSDSTIQGTGAITYVTVAVTT